MVSKITLDCDFLLLFKEGFVGLWIFLDLVHHCPGDGVNVTLLLDFRLW